MKIKQLLVSIYLMTISTYSNAEIMESWAKWMYSQLDSPIISTLNTYRSEGMVLIDVGKNYAAYSTSSTRLTEEQRDSISTVENDTDFVVSFNSCSSKQDNQFLDGNIKSVTVKRNITDASELVGEISDLIDLSARLTSTVGIVYSVPKTSKSFMTWSNKEEPSTLVALDINKETHQVVWTAKTEGDYAAELLNRMSGQAKTADYNTCSNKE